VPELPEVETLRRSLCGPLIGRRIEALQVVDRRLRVPVASTRLRRAIVGRRIVALGRRAKYLLVDLEEAQRLVVHLGMSGRLSMVPASEPRQSHTHVVLTLSDGWELRYRDPRRFGMVFAVDPSRMVRHPRFRNLGVEPLEDAFDVGYVHGRARGLRKPVKNFLMDAAVVVGVGNIYASEALFAARVSPLREVGRLRRARWQRIVDGVRAILLQAIEDGGTTLQDFHNGQGDPGWFQTRLQVYDREGQPCPRCGRRVRRIVQAGRSTFFCNGCQT
jgi:formamidopyrimidine-DNA glycosylase